MGGKKVAIAGLASILVVAMVVAVAVTVTKNHGGSSSGGGGGGGGGEVSTSSKAVQTICSPTDYRETCEKTLSGANSTDPKDLIKIAFTATMQNIDEVLKNSTLLKDAAADPSTKDALRICEDVLSTAVDDLQRSFDTVGEFNAGKMAEYVEDMRTWLSAVITYQETCIDAFENTTGDTGEKMKNLLQTTRELSSNGLAMVSDISSILGQLNLGSIGSSSSRRLMGEEEEEEGNPEEENFHRRLLAAGGKPNAVVALDGSGQFKKINDAINTVPMKNKVPFVIHIKAGVYKEYVAIPKGKHFIYLTGDGPTKTIITGNKNYAAGVKTFDSSTVSVHANDFFAKDMTIENTAGAEGHQAVALRITGDRAVVFNVHLDGYQDTLYAHTYRQFYRDCQISGTIDFVFGDALSIFQNCKFIVRQPMKNQACMVTAQGRADKRSSGAIVIQHGEIKAEPQFLSAKPSVKAYLGRPWKVLSRTIIMNTYIGGAIVPEGWSVWEGTKGLDTLYYAEFENNGPGSNTAHRVKWKGIQHISPQVAESFTPGKSFLGDEWIRNKGIPYVSGMMKA